MKPAIEVHHVTKEYRLGTMQSLRQLATTAGARLLGRAAAGPAPFKALDDVNFIIQPGEVVGVIGHNGAGKSTLLKILSHITKPTSGHVQVNGRVAPLIEVGAGFVGDMTGRENVYLNGAILGMSRKEIARKFDEIVDFAEMEKFIDTPVKRYSSGMQVKLAFAVATSIESEILIVDEVLAVGDLAFQRKCFDRMEDLIKRQQRTVLLVSHNIRQVERLCKRVIVMDKGRAVVDTEPVAGCNFFYEQQDHKIASNLQRDAGIAKAPSSTQGLKLLDIQLLDAQGQATRTIPYGTACNVLLTFFAPDNIGPVSFGIGLHTPDLIYVAMDDSTLGATGPINVAPGRLVVEYKIPRMDILPGKYAFRVGAAIDRTDTTVFYAENLASFNVSAAGLNRSRTAGQGFVRLNGNWTYARQTETATGEDFLDILPSVAET